MTKEQIIYLPNNSTESVEINNIPYNVNGIYGIGSMLNEGLRIVDTSTDDNYNCQSINLQEIRSKKLINIICDYDNLNISNSNIHSLNIGPYYEHANTIIDNLRGYNNILVEDVELGGYQKVISCKNSKIKKMDLSAEYDDADFTGSKVELFKIDAQNDTYGYVKLNNCKIGRLAIYGDDDPILRKKLNLENAFIDTLDLRYKGSILPYPHLNNTKINKVIISKKSALPYDFLEYLKTNTDFSVFNTELDSEDFEEWYWNDIKI